MRALTLYEAGKMEIRDIPRPVPGPDEILVEVGAVGHCGTDFHIYQGHANYHTDAAGRLDPLQDTPQILCHEFCGRVAEIRGNVRDLHVGDSVNVDQGLNCRSYGRAELCEYCATGNSHQCAEYAEHGITGLQGALAEAVAVPAINAVRIESDLPMEEAALVDGYRLELAADRLRVNGRATVQQSQFGIRPVTAGAGTVRVKDEVEVVLSVTARRP